MSEVVEFIDGPMILVSWVSTTAFGLIGKLLFTPGENKFKPVWLNLALFGVVFAAFVNLSYFTGIPIYQIPYYLYARVWDGTLKRACLLVFFIAQLAASFIFCAVQAKRTSTKATTSHRKFFHFTIGMIALSGIIFDHKFVSLSAFLMLQIFLILEFLRNLQCPPWSEFLNPYLRTFIDPNQESESLILTPLLLIFGVFLPILFSPISPSRPLALYHFAGIATVAIGDSFAAIIGSHFGATKLSKPFRSRNLLGLQQVSLIQKLFVHFKKLIMMLLKLLKFLKIKAPQGEKSEDDIKKTTTDDGSSSEDEGVGQGKSVEMTEDQKRLAEAAELGEAKIEDFSQHAQLSDLKSLKPPTVVQTTNERSVASQDIAEEEESDGEEVDATGVEEKDTEMQ